MDHLIRMQVIAGRKGRTCCHALEAFTSTNQDQVGVEQPVKRGSVYFSELALVIR